MVAIISPPASLETLSTQSNFTFSLSAERPESEKQQLTEQKHIHTIF
ncbi:hypothetical protein D1AOALGA4SA_1656 [Olavius algarvensis Delta 1 endosymbiont]|nr:hypothetical protein D1AOALGA4SA_1656 [Olavius algarvensis Delta 1 endosymbiont]